MKRMLINATQKEELRVALVDSQRLYDLDIESATNNQKKGNVYKAKITRVEPSLEAAFVDYGAERHGFLPIKEIAKEYYSESLDSSSKEKPDYKKLIKEGQHVLVQVDKEERGNKGAALTTYVSLAGRYLVVMPNNAGGGGISRRIQGTDRQSLKQMLDDVDIPKSVGIIARTAGVGRDSEELQWDLNYQMQVWEAIKNSYNDASIGLIYKESDIVVRALRDYFSDDIDQILIDSQSIYNRAQGFMSLVMPDKLRRLKFYQDELPLFTRYQIETQIDSAYGRNVRLPSGGELVIDYTEAMVSIDINSARSTKGGDVEETALHTNLEAAEEIARQLRLRDIGGLIVIDFIDMYDNKHRRLVEEKIKSSIQLDRARVQFARISKFGLLEMSRQRLRPSIDEASHFVCPRCKGQGSIRSTQSVALSVLRLIEENANKEKTRQVVVQLPVKVATFLSNEKRDAIYTIEKNNKVQVLIVANSTLEVPNYEVTRIRDDDDSLIGALSYKLKKDFALEEQQAEAEADSKKIVKETPIVSTIVPDAPAPAKSGFSNFWQKIKVLLGIEKPKKKSKSKNKNQRRNKNNQRSTQNRNGKNRRPNTKQNNKKSLSQGKERTQQNGKSKDIKQADKNTASQNNKHQKQGRQSSANKQLNRSSSHKAAKSATNRQQSENAKPFISPHANDVSKIHKGRPVCESAELGAGKANYQSEQQQIEQVWSENLSNASQNTKSEVTQAVKDNLSSDESKSKNNTAVYSANVNDSNKNKERVYVPRASNDVVRPIYLKNQTEDDEVPSTKVDKSNEVSQLTASDSSNNNESITQNKNTSDKNLIEQLSLSGQSVWYDNISRDMLSSGELARLIKEDDLRGVTSNPSIFEKAIASNHPEYLSHLAQVKSLVNSPKEAFFELAIKDIQDACDLMRPTYDKTNAIDGMVSLEVSPDLSYDAEKTIEEALVLKHKVNRENLMIKVPGTEQGLIAIEQLTYLGINVNVTLLFSVSRYEAVFKAYMNGLLKRAEMGLPVDKIASVASFFISRIDSQVDSKVSAGHPEVMGKVAIANAKLAYQSYLALLDSEQWQRLKVIGAKPQRLLWASTSTKNPDYSETLYVDELIGKDTVNTVPPATYNAFKQSGTISHTITSSIDEAKALIANLDTMNVDLDSITKQLEKEGIAAFEKSFDNLLAIVEEKLTVDE